jgi:hypothetical protein
MATIAIMQKLKIIKGHRLSSIGPIILRLQFSDPVSAIHARNKHARAQNNAPRLGSSTLSDDRDSDRAQTASAAEHLPIPPHRYVWPEQRTQEIFRQSARPAEEMSQSLENQIPHVIEIARSCCVPQSSSGFHPAPMPAA